jgi:hypothetical protein
MKRGCAPHLVQTAGVTGSGTAFSIHHHSAKSGTMAVIQFTSRAEEK